MDHREELPVLAADARPREGRLQHPVGQLARCFLEEPRADPLVDRSILVMLSVRSLPPDPRASASRAARRAVGRVVESGFDGARGDAEGLGDLGHGQPDVEVEDHDRPLLGLQAPEAALELVAVCQRVDAVVGRRFGPDHPDFRRPATLVPTLIGAGVDEEPTEPRLEPIRIAQSGQLSPCMDERLLDGVLGSLPVAQDEAGDGKEAVAGGHREGLEGLVIAALRRFHDIALHRLLHRLRDRRSRYTLRRSGRS